MSNYFDNQEKWSWQISEKGVYVTTDHGDHTHTLQVTDVPVCEMNDNTGQVMGDAHRFASHDFKESAEVENTNTEENTEEENTNIGENIEENTNTEENITENNDIETVETETSCESEEDGEECDDGLDF
jgi:hypothetical protein